MIVGRHSGRTARTGPTSTLPNRYSLPGVGGVRMGQPTRRPSMRFGLSLLALSVLTASLPAAPPAAKPKAVDVVLCLDTSNSMDGLIDSAKRKLWAVVNDLAKIEPAPTLRVALYSYGNDTYDPKAGWVRKDL